MLNRQSPFIDDAELRLSPTELLSYQSLMVPWTDRSEEGGI